MFFLLNVVEDGDITDININPVAGSRIISTGVPNSTRLTDLSSQMDVLFFFNILLLIDSILVSIGNVITCLSVVTNKIVFFALSSLNAIPDTTADCELPAFDVDSYEL